MEDLGNRMETDIIMDENGIFCNPSTMSEHEINKEKNFIVVFNMELIYFTCCYTIYNFNHC